MFIMACWGFWQQLVVVVFVCNTQGSRYWFYCFRYAEVVVIVFLMGKLTLNKEALSFRWFVSLTPNQLFTDGTRKPLFNLI